jgi:hypothetical protein
VTRHARRASVRVAASIAAAASAICFALPAFAQSYYVEYDVTSAAPATCTTAGVSGTATGTGILNLPANAGNAYSSVAVNGGAATVQIESIPGPFPLTVPLTNYEIEFPTAHALPYTFVSFAYPAVNGLPSGLGSSISGSCDVNGVGTVTFSSGIPAPAPQVVPTLSTWMLGLLGALLLLGALSQRRRVSP